MVALCLPWGELDAQGTWVPEFLCNRSTKDTLIVLGNNKDGVPLYFDDYVYSSDESSWVHTDFEVGYIYYWEFIHYTFGWGNPAQYYVKGLYLNVENGTSAPDNIYHTVTGDAYHFYGSVGLYNLTYAGYSLTDNKWGYQSPGFDFSLAPHATMTANEPAIDQKKGTYTQKLKWDIQNLNDSAITEVTIMASYDSGESWTPIHTSTKVRDSITTNLPWTIEKVRYYAVATKQERFSMLFNGDNGLTSEPTPDFTPQPVDVPCKLVVNLIGTFNDADDYRDRSYTVPAIWNVPSADAFQSAYLQYSTIENSDEWHTILQCKKATGIENIAIPVGYTNYIYRLVVKAPENTPLLHDSTIVLLHNPRSYNASFTSLSVKGTLDESYNAETDSITPTIQYVMNDALYQIRNSPAQISYSIDGGETWHIAATIANPQQSGEAQIKLPSTGNEYLFRIKCGTMMDNVLGTAVDLTSESYPFTKVIHLNDTKDYTPICVKGAKVIVNRAYTAGKLGTICLPFDLSAEQIAEAFGSGTRVYAFDNITGETMDFKQVHEIMGAVPYLIRPTASVDSIVVSNISIVESTTQPYPFTHQNEQNESYTLAGTFSPYLLNTDGTELYITTDGKAKRPSDTGNRMKGYRAYIILPSADAEVKVNVDGDVTSIEDIHPATPQRVNVYNTNGQLISHTTDHLPKGIYIVNGKKLVIP